MTENNPQTWPKILPTLGLKGRALELAKNCILSKMDSDQVHLLVDPDYKIIGSTVLVRITDANQHFGKQIQLHITEQVKQ